MLAGDAKVRSPTSTRALELEPTDGGAVQSRGGFAEDSASTHAHRRSFETIWSDAKSPLRARAAYHDALALDAMRKATDAEAWLARALELDP